MAFRHVSSLTIAFISSSNRRLCRMTAAGKDYIFDGHLTSVNFRLRKYACRLQYQINDGADASGFLTIPIKKTGPRF